MNISEAKEMILSAVENNLEIWADLGCGVGLFTLALAEILKDGSSVYAVDKSVQSFPAKHSEVRLFFKEGDFSESLELPLLDGILMANSFHFIKNKKQLIRHLETYFKNTKKWIIVEYDNSVANQWEPYSIPFEELKLLFIEMGYSNIEKIGERKSKFGGMMYAAKIS